MTLRPWDVYMEYSSWIEENRVGGGYYLEGELGVTAASLGLASHLGPDVY